LNCHTSKRKCDRKRPCQRCIQLGLTGLCVYEIDDPALRDDPSVDETTRLRNRIAELESLVRELRGKPHPRWAESNFRDGDPNEKWHSRATKCVPLSAKRRATSPELVQDHHTSSNGRSNVISSLLTPIKTEAPADSAPHLYRFSPSPAPSMRYHTFQTQGEVRGSPGSATFENDHRPSYANGSNPNGSYHAPGSSSTPGASYGNGTAGPSSYSDGGNSYSISGSDDGRAFGDHYSPGGHSTGSSGGSYCPCRTNPSTGHVYMTLAQQLQTTLNTVRYNHSSANASCVLYRRISELHNLIQSSESVGDPTTRPQYDSNTPTESEILTPLSASSGHSFHSGSPGAVSPHEWSSISTGSYSSYFPGPPPPTEHNIYSHVMT
jgi:hypothetical protein